MRYALPLVECTADRAPEVGGKAIGLGSLLRQAREVPPGFVVPTGAYREWVAGHGLEPEIERLSGGATDAAAQEAASREIHALFAGAALTGDLAAEVTAAYEALGEDLEEEVVAVRSSATAEDMADASFAGQQESYLGVTGAESVLAHVVRCWASLFTPQAISYRLRLGIPAGQVAMAVLVQRLVAAEAAGVMLTIDPVTGDRSQITIEGAHGLGAPLVGGELTPDRFAVDKVTLELRSRTVTRKPFAERYDHATRAVIRQELAEAEGDAPSLGDEEVVRIARIGKEVERAHGGAVDVEWALGPGPDGPRHLYLLQARPETVWSAKQASSIARPETTALDRMVAVMLGSRRNQGKA
jgi:phosphoenolpyruvate synthase/pyruvate phosphate dikinase